MAAESAEIWDRWRRGEGLWTIARAFGKSSGSIYAHNQSDWRHPTTSATALAAGSDDGRAGGDLPRPGARPFAAPDRLWVGISTVMNADQILVLDDGEIVARGRHAELLEENPIYAEIYSSQLVDDAATIPASELVEALALEPGD